MSSLDTLTTYKSPLEVYVLWRPNPEGGTVCDEIAATIYSELCRDSDQPLNRGAGIPTYFRNTPGAGQKVPIDIDVEGSTRTCIIVLIDFEMVIDADWTAYVADLRVQIEASPNYHLLLPVLLDREAANFQGIDDINGIPYFKYEGDPKLSTVTRIYHELCRQLADDTRPIHAPAPVRLFLSHAKRDGETEAKKLKRRIEDATPAKPFFDTIDIASGYKFPGEIENSLQESVLIAIVTDEYSSRPWCRREVLMAKKFERPVIAVSALEKEDFRQFPYLGNVRVIRWREDIDVIIHAALLEALRFEYFRQRLVALQETGRFPMDAKVMARPPELLDCQLFLNSDEGEVSHHVVYPDPPLGMEELEALEGFCRRTQFLTPVMPVGRKNLGGRVIALSVSDSGDLAVRGLSPLHLRDATNEIARYLLARDATLAYGGDLRKDGFTGGLLDLVFTYAGGSDSGRLHNFRAWPIHAFQTAAARRQLASIKDRSTFHDLDLPPDVVGDFPDVALAAPDPSTPEGRYIWARSLTFMREHMQARVSARVLLGGKVAGFSGKYPGVLEEAMLAIESPTESPLFVLGGYGGCAAVIAEALMGRRPAELTFDFQTRANPTYSEFVEKYNKVAAERTALGLAAIDHDHIVRTLNKGGVSALRNGLDEPHNLRLMKSIDLEEITYLILKGLGNLFYTPG